MRMVQISIVIASALLLLPTVNAVGQWQRMDVSRGGLIYSMCSTPDSTLFAITRDGFAKKEQGGEWMFVNEVKATETSSLDVWGTNVLVWPNDGSLRMLSTDNGTTWRYQEPSTDGFNQLYLSTLSARYRDVNGEGGYITTWNCTTWTRDSLFISHDSATMTYQRLIVGANEVFLEFKVKADSSFRHIRISDLDKPSIQWIQRTHSGCRFGEIPRRIRGYGVCAFNSITGIGTLVFTNGETDTLFEYYQNMHNAMFKSNGRWFYSNDVRKVNDTLQSLIYTSLDGKTWNLYKVLSLVSSPSRLTYVHGSTFYFTGFSYTESDSAINSVFEGLTRPTTLAQHNNKLYSLGCAQGSGWGAATWRDAKTINDIEYHSGELYQVNQSSHWRSMCDRLWEIPSKGKSIDMQSFKWLDATTKLNATDVACVDGTSFFLLKDTVYIQAPNDTVARKLLPAPSILRWTVRLVSIGSEVMIVRWRNEQGFYYTEGVCYDAHGNYTRTIPIEDAIETGRIHNMGSEFVLMLAPNYLKISSGNGTVWTQVQYPIETTRDPTITDYGVFIWDSVRVGVWKKVSVDSNWVFYDTPPLPGSVLYNVICAPNNIYVNTSVGIFQLPIDQANAVDEKSVGGEPRVDFVVNHDFIVTSSISGKVSVYTTNGELISQHDLNAGTGLSLNALLSGVYMVAFQTDAGVESKLVLKYQ